MAIFYCFYSARLITVIYLSAAAKRLQIRQRRVRAGPLSGQATRLRCDWIRHVSHSRAGHIIGDHIRVGTNAIDMATISIASVTLAPLAR